MAIRQLPLTLINRIAAGEVVERPASVVKELIENAIDAGASRIDVVATGGGLSLIRVADDGSGMSPEDLALAVERHATSKLTDDSLSNILTLGFRGEALPSIGAVARLAMQSALHGAGEAYAIAVDAGRKSPLKPAVAIAGTQVEVRDLFYTTPARLKFMKSERAETAAIASYSQANRFIQALKEFGCRFALDDFGTGLSSFGYLKHFPVDFLKIDGSFVKEILHDPIDREMVRSINEIGHLTGKQTIAEFAENEEIIAMLRGMGVDDAQGYGVSEPKRIVREMDEDIETGDLV